MIEGGIYITAMVELKDWEYEFISMPTVIKQEKRWLLERTQKNLWKCDFWKSVFYKVLERHSFQKEFYLLGNEPTPQSVEIYLHNFLKSLQEKYEVACRRNTAKGFVELGLGVSYLGSHSRKRQMASASELAVYIDDSQITLSLLPYSGMVGKYYLDDYLIVEKVIKDFCEDLFGEPAEQLADFQDLRRSLDAHDMALNFRSIEIARSSINCLYEKAGGEEDNKFQGYLFTLFDIDGREEYILHKEFLDDPQVLISKLKKK